MRETWQLIRQDPALNKKLVTAFVLLFLFGYGQYFRVGLDARMMITESQIADRLSVIEKARQEETLYLSEVAVLPKLTKSDEVDVVQNGLIKKMAAYSLDVNSMNAVAAPAAAANTEAAKNNIVGLEYEVTVTGSWESTMRYLNDLKRENKLITLLMVRMESTQTQNVKTTFRYKLYTERGK